MPLLRGCLLRSAVCNPGFWHGRISSSNRHDRHVRIFSGSLSTGRICRPVNFGAWLHVALDIVGMEFHEARKHIIPTAVPRPLGHCVTAGAICVNKSYSEKCTEPEP